MRNRSGFTVVEFLVVCFVLFILFAMVLVSLANQRHRGPAYKTKCLNNTKQLGLAISMYSSSQYYGVMPKVATPAAGDSADEQGTAVGLLHAGGNGIIGDFSVFKCPSGDNDYTLNSPYGKMANTIDAYNETDYILSMGVTTSSQANMIILTDHGGRSLSPTSGGTHFGFIHSDGQTALYKDGHGKFMSRTENGDKDCDDSGIYSYGSGGSTDTAIW